MAGPHDEDTIALKKNNVESYLKKKQKWYNVVKL